MRSLPALLHGLSLAGRSAPGVAVASSLEPARWCWFGIPHLMDARISTTKRRTTPFCIARYDGSLFSRDSCVSQQRPNGRPILLLAGALSHHLDLLTCSRPC